jgi:uncharacterized protein DUF1942
MRKTTIASAASVTLSLAALTIVTATTAVAANPTTAAFGTRQQLTDASGTVVTGWTISNLTPSSDVIPYPVAGRLYEVTSVVEADQGAVTPIVSNFNARAADGETYRALFNVATPQGVDPTTLTPGAKSTGKIYFDVTGVNPNSVVYGDGAQDLLIWTGGAAAPAEATPAPAPAAPTPAPAAPAPAPAAAPAPTAAPTPAPAPAATPGATSSMPSGNTPAAATGQSSASSGSMPSGTTPAGGTTTGVSGVTAGSPGPGANPAGRT